MKLLKMSSFTFLHNVFYAICILKSINSHFSVVVCSFFEFGTVSKCCIREWVNLKDDNLYSIVTIANFISDSLKSLGRSVIELIPSIRSTYLRQNIALRVIAHLKYVLGKIKALKTTVWHLSREPMKEMISLNNK